MYSARAISGKTIPFTCVRPEYPAGLAARMPATSMIGIEEGLAIIAQVSASTNCTKQQRRLHRGSEVLSYETFFSFMPACEFMQGAHCACLVSKLLPMKHESTLKLLPGHSISIFRHRRTRFPIHPRCLHAWNGETARRQTPAGLNHVTRL